MQIEPPLQDNRDYNYFVSICEQNNIDFRIVGGCSRDLILGRTPKDIDIAIKCRINFFIKILDNNNVKYNSYAIKYSSILIKFESCNIEVTSLRIDFDQSGRKTQIAFTTSWKKDSLRRDFTINAIYIDRFGKVYDFHNGIKHLTEQKIQFIGNVKEKTEMLPIKAKTGSAQAAQTGKCTIWEPPELECYYAVDTGQLLYPAHAAPPIGALRRSRTPRCGCAIR